MLGQLGIIQVTQDLPFRLNHVNCFLAEGDSGWTIIDTGLHQKQTIERWNDHLTDKTISDIIITHYHPDHYGYAGALQEKTKANLSMTQIDYQTAKHAWTKEFIHSFYTYYNWAGVPKTLSEQMIKNNETFISKVTPHPTVDHYLEEGDILRFGHYDYEVIFTPGHSSGLVCLFNEEKSVIISTDHILPRITPNISYWFVGDPNPLETYLNSLKKIKKYDADFVIPSHGDPFYGANERVDEIIKHHNERLEQMLMNLEGKMTVFEVCQQLFPFKLTIHEMRFAIGETLSHLEYLRLKNKCKREIINDIWYYMK